MKKKKLFLILIIVMAMLGGAVYYAVKSRNHISYIDKQVSEYTKTGQWEDEIFSASFSPDSAEAYFSKGMLCYADSRYEEAEQFFKQAEQKSYTDAAFPVYLNIYLNECSIAKTGNGNVTYVQKALDAAANYPDMTNAPYWVWNLAYSAMEQEETDVSAPDLLQKYIDNANYLSQDEILQMESYYAILRNISGDYSKSILLFYDILNKAQDMPDTFPVIKAQSVCINYIADMYYSYEDYERATELYLMLLNKEIEDPHENASLKYTAYINMADIYLKQKNYGQSKKMAEETKAILPYLNENTAAEIQAFLFNILTNIELEQDNLDGAKTYFKECEDFLLNYEFSAFFDTEVYFKLTQAKILKKSGDLEEARKILTNLLKHTIIEDKMRYEIRELLADIYLLSGDKIQYYKEHDILLNEQNARINQYQSDYCEVISYYDQLVSLRKEHSISLQHNEVLVIILFIALFLLLLIIKLSLNRYHDSVTDALSGLYNRKQLEKETTYYEKNSHRLMSYGVIMTDIDLFKRYNDTYGHAAGDEVIRRVSAILKRSVRERDIVIRYGGEEFLILLKDINHSTIESIAERIRLNIENEKISHETSECSDYISLSLGCFYVENTSLIPLSDAIKEADKALYASKQNGRNRVTLY